MPTDAPIPFWKAKSLTDMSASEWESLCDGCGKCCLLKLEDEDTGEVFQTNVVCRYLDMKTCRCSEYRKRARLVPECLVLKPEHLSLPWLPDTCAYRLLAEGRDLPDWHPLVSGESLSVFEAGHSVRGRVISEDEAGDLEHHLVSDRM